MHTHRRLPRKRGAGCDRGRQASISVVIWTAAWLGLAASALAHEGHDHGPPAPSLPTAVKPRIAVESEAYQLVAIANGEQLTIFLDRYASNEPVTDAAVSILAGATSIAAARRRDGSYTASVPGIGAAGRHEMIFNVAHPTGDDLLAGALDVQSPLARLTTTSAAGPTGFPVPSMLVTAFAVLAGLAIGMAVRTRRAIVVATAAVLCVALLATAALAHDGHEPSPVPDSTSLTGEAPRRLADGSIFLPKPSQRLLTIRSQVATEGQARRGVALVGRIIPDPNRSGVVQSIIGGRVTPPHGGLPLLGQQVRRGDVLATVEPALPLADQSTLAEKQRELEGSILLARQKLSRLTRIGPPAVARGTIEDAELEVANLELRLTSLKSAKLQPEALTAPIDGIVSMSRVVAGQVVGAQDLLFQIVDPVSLWVEALLFDQIDPGAISQATAIAANGVVMKLDYRGRGRTVQAQAIQLQFAIQTPPASAAVGQPVTVIVQQSDPINGIIIPRDAVVRGAAGETIVWHHVEPERFVARQVKVEPFDGERMLLTAGIAPRDRIVVHGAESLSQVR